MDGRFKTKRLVIERWNDSLTVSELQELEEILDEEVTAFLPPNLVYRTGVTDVAEWAKTFSEGSNKVSSVRLDSKLAGLLILMAGDEEEGSPMHLGYIFGKECWGRGLATELLRGLVQQLTIDGYEGEIHAGVAKGNPASVRVLEKVGFVPMTGAQDSDVHWFCRSFESAGG